MKWAVYMLWILMLSGCASTKTSLDPQIIENQGGRLQAIGQLSSGIDYALEQEKPQVAANLNDSVAVLADQPTQKQVSTIKKAVDDGRLDAATENGINVLTEQRQELNASIMLRLAEVEANNAKLTARNESMSQELEKFDSGWFSIKHGVITLIKKFMYWGIGFGVVFLILRILSASNPIAAAVFSVFEHFVAAIFKGLAALLPRVFSFAGYVSKETDELKSAALRKIVDGVQSMKGSEEIARLKTELAKAMDEKEKRLVDEVKRDLGY